MIFFPLCAVHDGYVLGEDLGFLKEHLQYHTAKFERRLLSKLGILYMEEVLCSRLQCLLWL